MRSTLIIAVLVLLTLGVQGQNAAPSVGLADESIRRKARSLAETSLDQIPAIESLENQVVLLTLATELMWDVDQKRARQIAQEAALKFRSVLNPLLSEGQKGDFITYPPQRMNNLRADFLAMLARHDANLARELAVNTRTSLFSYALKSENQFRQHENWLEQERDLEQRIAFQVAASNAAEALELGNASLKLGISQEAINLLRRLQLRGTQKANAFAASLIDKLLIAKFEANNAAVQLAGMILIQFDDGQGVFGKGCRCSGKMLTVNAGKLNRLAAKWLDFALALPDDQISRHFFELRSVLVQMLPARAKAIDEKIELIRKKNGAFAEGADLRARARDDGVEPSAMAQDALKKPDGERFHVYRMAFNKAANRSKNELLKLRDALATHPDGKDKAWVMDQIAANLAGKTAEEGDLEAAREMARDVQGRDRRIGLLSWLALEYLKKNEEEKAKEITREVGSMLDLYSKDEMPKAIVGYDVFPGVFRALAMTDPGGALSLLEITLPQFGPQVVKSYPHSNVDARLDLRTMIKRNRYYGETFAGPIQRIAANDLDRTIRMTEYFGSPEMSILMKLVVAQAVLSGRLGYEDFTSRREMLLLKD